MDTSRLNLEKILYEDIVGDSMLNEYAVQLEILRNGPHIGAREEANEHEVYNEFILKGYRINYKTWRVTF